MSVPSRMSMRSIPRALEPRVRIAYAVAWEGVITTHSNQVLEFIHEFASRMDALEALDLYFRVVAVPEPMQESVRTRALPELDLDCLPTRKPLPTLGGWKLLRADLVLRMIRYRRDYAETTLHLARMVGARAAEAVTATHVSHAIEFARLLNGVLPVDKAVAHYVYVFTLSQASAQTVLQRVQATLAGQQLAQAYRTISPPLWTDEMPTSIPPGQDHEEHAVGPETSG
ncbi:MAG: hypothetical protein ABI679_16525 [Gemmatimonadota bacterium]